MKPFRFPLQAVLTVRKNQESKALEAFALAQNEFEKVAARYLVIQNNIEDTLGRRRDALRTSASSEDIQQMQQGLRALHESLQRCRIELEKAQAKLEDKSRLLLEARQKREVVEKVRDKQLTRHRVKSSREEQKVLDDLATLKSMGDVALKWR